MSQQRIGRFPAHLISSCGKSSKHLSREIICAVFLLLSAMATCALGQQGWSEGEWNEPTFVLKRICQLKQADSSHYYEVGVADGRKQRTGVLGPQTGDVTQPTAEVTFQNGSSCRVQLMIDAPASFSIRAGATISCTARVTISAPAEIKKGAKIRLFLRTPICPDDIDSLETAFAPGKTFTEVLKGSVKIIHKAWHPKFGVSGPSWDWLRVPGGRLVTQDRIQSRMEAVNSSAFDMGPNSALKDDVSEDFEIYGYVAGERITADVTCIYEGVAYKKGAEPVAQPPAPPPPPEPEADDLDPTRAQVRVNVRNESFEADEIRRLFKLFKRVRDMERRVEMSNVQLSLTARAISDLRRRIADLDAAARDKALYEVERETASEKAAELRKELGTLLESQDKLIKDVTAQYHELTLNVALEKDRVGASDEVIQKLSAVHATLVKQDELLPLQMYFAAEQRDKFEAISRDLLSRFVQRDAVFRLRAMDYTRRGDPRSALYALREALKIDPKDSLSRTMATDLEVGYLRAVAAKTTGDAAEVRAKFNEALMGKGEAGWLNYAKDLFTTGPGALISVATGKLEAQERLAATLGDEAAVTQAGTQILIRLRQKGYSWDDINSMTGEKFAAAMRHMTDSERGAALDDKTAMRMRASVHMALQNPDVKRIMAQSREEFDTVGGNSYLATDAFDVTWVDHAADAVNIANVASLVPGATVGRAGTFKMVGAAELADATTVSQSLMAAMKVGKLAAYMEETKAGKLALDQLNRFNESTGIVSKMLAQTLVDQGVLEVGRRLGGKPGEIAADIITTLGATDIDAAISAIERRGLKAADVDLFLTRARKQVDLLNQYSVPPKSYTAEFNRIKTALNKDGAELSQKAQQDLRAAADNWFNQDRPKFSEGPFFMSHDALRLEQHKHYVTHQALDAASHGNKAPLKPAEEYIEDLEKEAVEEAARLNKQVEVLDKVSKRMKEVPIAETPAPVVTGGGTGGRTGAVDATGGRAAVGATGGRKPLNVTKLSNDALVDPKLTEGLGHVAQQADEAFRMQRYNEARIRYALLAESPDVPAKTKADIAQRMKFIEDMKNVRAAETASRELAERAGTRVRVSDTFDSGTTKYINGLKESDLVPMDGQGTFAKPMKILAPAVGDGKDPRQVIAVFKPRQYVNDKGKLIKTGMEGELAFAKLAPMLGLETPHVARATIMGNNGRAIDGYVIKWVDDAPKVADVPVAAMLNSKQQIAQERVASLFMSDHDRHAGNNLLRQTGQLVSIDHGMANLMEETFRLPGMTREQARKELTEAMELRIDTLRNDSDNVRLLDKYICYEDMEPMVKRVKELSPTQLEDVVKAGYVGETLTANDLALAVDNFQLKQEIIEDVLRRKFPSARVR